jgi:hypothetical protein
LAKGIKKSKIEHCQGQSISLIQVGWFNPTVPKILKVLKIGEEVKVLPVSQGNGPCDVMRVILFNHIINGSKIV